MQENHKFNFGDELEWHIYKHHVYGSAFRNAWLSRDLLGTEEAEQLIDNEVEEDENFILQD